MKAREKTFEDVCDLVSGAMERKWKSIDDAGKIRRLAQEKRAIMGYEEDMTFYKSEIGRILKDEALEAVKPPPWYRNLVEGVFAELYGLAGLAPWVYDETEVYARSSSAKLIGDRLYCLIDGVTTLQPQRISGERREQLKRALLMATPRERLEKGFHEVYLRNGIRLTIYAGDRTKEGQDVMVFRKYLLEQLDFEKLVELGTIPPEAPELFRAMVKIGYNVLFCGPVRSGKTTFLQIWQACEDPNLEGVAISTDPETPWHEIMPEAPIMQLVADGKDLENMTKSLLRGDNDYILLEEMRDEVAYRLALEITSLGTRRCKATVHTGDSLSLPYKMASRIRSRYGGDEQELIAQVFSNFHYIFEFVQDEENRARKRLKAISEYCFDGEQNQVSIHTLCSYEPDSQTWQWDPHIGQTQEQIGRMRPEELTIMRDTLKELSERNPLKTKSIIYPRYYRPDRGKEPVEV